MRKDLGGRQTKRWSEAEDAIIRCFYETGGNDFMLSQLPGRTLTAICQRAKGMGIRKSAAHRAESSRKAFFDAWERRGKPPGQAPRPVGAMHRKGRYILVKVAQPDVWKPLHMHTWEQANGPVPEGMIVAAKDGNVRNIELDNLCLRTLSENQVRRHAKHKDLPEELIDILHLQNEIKKEIKRRKS
ncbi:MAG: HNH endonuclease signature motif containing protein [Pseudomonas sp.]|uniref:HNH endonuclease signature motif containing protein n=1 Tax=Pseudomonas TaxID=286 RepID=UPI0030352C2E